MSNALTHLAKIPDVKEVKRVKQLTVAQAKLVVAHLEKRPDVLQTQELQKNKGKEGRQKHINARSN